MSVVDGAAMDRITVQIRGLWLGVGSERNPSFYGSYLMPNHLMAVANELDVLRSAEIRLSEDALLFKKFTEFDRYIARAQAFSEAITVVHRVFIQQLKESEDVDSGSGD